MHLSPAPSRDGIDKSPYRAKYLVVLDDESALRAFLFGGDHRYLAEVIDDDNGLLIENLVRESTACTPPAAVARHDLLAQRHDLQCFALE